jgi:alpha-ketoglutarate-dependent taurine dioxygenase
MSASGLNDQNMTEFTFSEAQRREVRAAARRQVSVGMDLRPGDMQFLNNHTILHSRTAYEDYPEPEPERRRDLIRLWLDVPSGEDDIM